jgi:2-hydroxychromene-2-carboxylate isomerase
MSTSVDFWFDPSCRFTWRTSRWLTGVARARGLQVIWRLMSLSILHEGKEVSAKKRASLDRAQVALRFLEAVRAEHGNEALARVYSELGRRVHEQRQDLDEDAFRSALADADLPPALAAVGSDGSLQDAVARSHAQAQARVGREAGSPVIAVDGGPGFFGPVVVPVPEGAEALRLFDAVALLSTVPAFSELKRARARF